MFLELFLLSAVLFALYLYFNESPAFSYTFGRNVGSPMVQGSDNTQSKSRC